MSKHAAASRSFSALVGMALASLVTPSTSHRELASLAFTTADGAGYGTNHAHIQPINTSAFHAEMLTVQGDYFPECTVEQLTQAWGYMVPPVLAVS